MERTRIIVDTSAWIAFILSNEKLHKEMVDFFSRERDAGTIFVTSNDIVDETVTRLIYDSRLEVAQKFISLMQESVQKKVLAQLWTDEEIQAEAFAILDKFSDHKLSLTDATTVAIVNRFNLDGVLTLDGHFKEIGIRQFGA